MRNEIERKETNKAIARLFISLLDVGNCSAVHQGMHQDVTPSFVNPLCTSRQKQHRALHTSGFSIFVFNHLSPPLLFIASHIHISISISTRLCSDHRAIRNSTIRAPYSLLARACSNHLHLHLIRTLHIPFHA